MAQLTGHCMLDMNVGTTDKESILKNIPFECCVGVSQENSSQSENELPQVSMTLINKVI